MLKILLSIGENLTISSSCLLYTSDAADDTPCVDLGLRRILGRAVLELARHAAGLQQPLAPGSLAGLARRQTSLRGADGLADDVLGVVRVALDPVPEFVSDHALHERLGLGVAQLGLGLALELGVAELDRDDRGEALADVLAGEVVVLVPQELELAGLAVDHRGQRGAEALLVGAALVRVDRVRVGVHRLAVGGCLLYTSPSPRD